MRVRKALAAIAVVVVANGLALAHVAANRSGVPDATMKLTERELPVSSRSPELESSRVALGIEVDHFIPWSSPSDADLEPFAWLDAEKLRALGFDVRIPEDPDAADTFDVRQLARRAIAVVEYDGPALESYRERLARRFDLELNDTSSPAADDESERRGALRELQFGSRLMIVDAGTDAAALRRRYPDPDSYLLLPAEVSVWLDRDPDSRHCRPARCTLRGQLNLLIREVTVPRRLHGVLPDSARGEGPPRYDVLLYTGKHLEPWVEDIVPLGK